MLIHLLGPDVPEPVLKAFATATDHARVRLADVHFDQVAAMVTVPVRLAQVTFRSRLRGFKHSPAGPAHSRLVVRHVTACKINVLAVEPAIEEVELIFGIQVEKNRLYACSAEEYHGQPLFDIDVTLANVDIELTT